MQPLARGEKGKPLNGSVKPFFGFLADVISVSDALLELLASHIVGINS